MTTYPLPPLLLKGDCLAELRRLPDNSVDAIVTDPPYGLSNTKPELVIKAMTEWASGNRSFIPDGRGFMGKDWDAFVPPPAVWDECMRVLKPGGHLLAFAGSRTFDLMTLSIRFAGFDIRDSFAWLYGSGFPKSMDLGKKLDEWQGWGTALKPAFEPIVMARKPLAGTVAANVLEHGTGALNIDASRVQGPGAEAGRTRHGGGIAGAGSSFELPDDRSKESPAGRHPANVILDESQAAALDEQTGYMKDGVAVKRNTQGTRKPAEGRATSIGQGMVTQGEDQGYGSGGGASRFFYVAKAPKSERPVVDGTAHPTVKPLSLMRYLIRMVTPPGGTIVDPFAGSGTTLEAAHLEGFDAIGVELTPDYWPLIEARIARALDTPSGQP